MLKRFRFLSLLGAIVFLATLFVASRGTPPETLMSPSWRGLGKEAELLARNAGCLNCHGTSADQHDFGGPSLKGVRAKLSTDWMVKYLESPSAYNEHVRMPSPRWGKDAASEISAIVKYLESNSEAPPKFVKAPSGDAERGKALFGSIGCLGCHGIDDFKRPRFNSGPDLSSIGSKVKSDWLFAWLKDPTHVVKSARMPNFRLTDKEAADLVAYLVTKKNLQFQIQGREPVDSSLDGKKLVGEYRCFQCHDIEGFGKSAPIARADLKVAKGEFTHSQYTFHFDSEEQRQIRVWLAAAAKDTTAMMRVMHRYNCQGCHTVEELHHPLSEDHPDYQTNERRKYRLEGRILAYYQDDETLGPPAIIDEGKKIFPLWGDRFLREPFALRFALQVRMPRFPLTFPELDAIRQGWEKEAGPNAPAQNQKITLSKEKYEAGKILFARLNCLGCHGDKNQTASAGIQQGLAPQFHHAFKRLRREWILSWLKDPQKYQPGTRMPGFWPDGISPVPDVLNGDATLQQEALTDYVLSISQ